MKPGFRHRSALRLLLRTGLCALFLAGCTPLEDDAPPRRAVKRPSMLFDDAVTMDFHDGPLLVWRLRTGYLERWSNDERLFVRPVDVEFFDSLGRKNATLRADSGTLDGNLTYIRAYGNVHAQSFDGASVRSDSLLYDKNRDKVTTDAEVRVVSRDGDVLQGRGLVSDARLRDWRIVSEVRGIFQDAGPRIKTEEK
ncbi:MAG: LPS export ABC transporter periplasmic protein LptC [Fibrobacterales bacterium]|nr:LPS export ABC transporter periplasmic protein LptC [Fibrobacterales bacterium]